MPVVSAKYWNGVHGANNTPADVEQDEEGLQTTANGMISVAKPIEFDEEKFNVELEDLIKASFAESDDIRSLIAGIVPTYKPKN